MIVEYLKVLAQSCKALFQEMTGTPVISASIKREQRLSESYDLAVTVQFRDLDHKLTGHILMGFPDGRMAQLMAGVLAEKQGLPVSPSLDEMAVDTLSEFLNTVVGHTITGWDEAGLHVIFDPPAALRSATLPTYSDPQADSFVIILNLSFGWIVFGVTFIDLTQQVRGMKVMVVDDSRLIRGLLGQALEQLGLVVAQAGDGEEAIRLHREFNPDLTIMDLVMPKMGGLDAILEIRETAPEAKFIILSSSARQEERITASTLNVSDYLLKPVKLDAFVETVKCVLTGAPACPLTSAKKGKKGSPAKAGG
jgi:CheY-like chemotaxis protein/CheY-specific phosphatase CheX